MSKSISLKHITFKQLHKAERERERKRIISFSCAMKGRKNEALMKDAFILNWPKMGREVHTCAET